MGGRNGKSATADVGFVVVGSSNLWGSQIRPISRRQYMYEPRYSCLMVCVCITGAHYEGMREEGHWANVAIV